MAGYKGKGTIKQGGNPSPGIRTGGTPTGGIRAGGNPGSIMGQRPSWRLIRCDQTGRWAFNEERVGPIFWSEIYTKLIHFESMTWNDIMLESKKQNHSIDVHDLNKDAQDRLTELRIEAEAIFSLRLEGKIRIYGYLEGAVYYILWYDDDHGDNTTCVCRSRKK